jgi:hypothetical protein
MENANFCRSFFSLYGFAFSLNARHDFNEFMRLHLRRLSTFIFFFQFRNIRVLYVKLSEMYSFYLILTSRVTIIISKFK